MKDDYTNRSFIKDENYSEPKNARLINSYEDITKSILGPLMHAIDHCVFSQKYFVKGSHPNTWPKRLLDLFGKEPVINTDFTSMEAHHQGVLGWSVYYTFMHITRNLKQYRTMRYLISRLMKEVNVVKCKLVTAHVKQRLMSGALWTSSANSVLNFLICTFLVAKNMSDDVEEMAKFTKYKFKGLFEGDDGIFPKYIIKDQDIKDLGLRLKIKNCADFSDAGFCSITCGMSLNNIRDPIKTISTLAILPKKYVGCTIKTQKRLMRGRCLSLKTLYPHSPIVGALLDTILYELRTVHAKFDESMIAYHAIGNIDLDSWKIQAEPTMEDRCLVDRIFDISITEQLILENKFNYKEKKVVFPIEHDFSAYANHNMYWYMDNFYTRDVQGWTAPGIRYPDLHDEFLNKVNVCCERYRKIKEVPIQDRISVPNFVISENICSINYFNKQL